MIASLATADEGLIDLNPLHEAGTFDWSLGKVSTTARVTYYGNVLVTGTTAASDMNTGKKVVTDMETRFRPVKEMQFAIGGNNIFDVYPDYAPAALNPQGIGAFPFYSPFGFNGRFLYARISLNL